MAPMSQTDLKLQVGEPLQLQPRDGEGSRRMHVKVIGYLPGQSLVVTTPRVRDKVMIIREGQPFVARVMIGNRIVGFATTVLRSCAVPYPYLHLSYPEEMEQITVRKAQRVRVKLFASVKNSNPEFQSQKPQPVTVVDISTSGAQVISGDAIGEVGDRVQLNCLLRVGDTEKLLTIPALLRNVHLEDEGGADNYSHGLEFQLTDQQDIFALHGFVYEQIVKLQSE
jgi:c-di-GMP-binding flagellar brake protein YcgR